MTLAVRTETLRQEVAQLEALVARILGNVS